MSGPAAHPGRLGLRGARGCWRLRALDFFDVVLTSDPEQIRWLNQHPDVTRPLDPRASPLHRLLHRRLERDLGFTGGVLPVFGARGEPARAARQAALTARLDQKAGAPSWEQDEIARHIQGLATSDLGAVVQEWCGRLFADAYRATPESYAAGRLIAEWPAAPPWTTLAARLSGRLQRAKGHVEQAAEGDLYCVHATSIGMQNIVRSVRALARAKRLPEFDNATARRALSRCLAVPPAVLRGCRAPIQVPFLSRPLTRRTLVVFLLARAHARSGDIDVAFLSDSWSGCPARHVVPEMLREAWYAARPSEARETSWPARLEPWGRALLRAVAAFEGRAS